MISVAKLPPKKGYVEKVNPKTGDHYYVKNNFQISGYIRREIIVDSNRSITLPLAKDYKYKITLIGGGGSKNSLRNGSNAECVKAIVNLCVGENTISLSVMLEQTVMLESRLYLVQSLFPMADLMSSTPLMVLPLMVLLMVLVKLWIILLLRVFVSSNTMSLSMSKI